MTDPIRLIGVGIIMLTLWFWLRSIRRDDLKESLMDHARREAQSGWDGGTHWPTKSNPKGPKS